MIESKVDIFFSVVAEIEGGVPTNTPVRYSQPRNRFIHVSISIWQRYPDNLMEEG